MSQKGKLFGLWMLGIVLFAVSILLIIYSISMGGTYLILLIFAILTLYLGSKSLISFNSGYEKYEQMKKEGVKSGFKL